MAEPEQVPLGRNCANPVCDRPLFATKEASAKTHCGSDCRVISWSIKKMQEMIQEKDTILINRTEAFVTGER